ncbi:MAG: sigma-70 family RNA polymerase sigma factor [Bacteroidetes bacterium]|nr:sigma-70 family RNA polymerase sigma factor [Bacteroidota bacterium]
MSSSSFDIELLRRLNTPHLRDAAFGEFYDAVSRHVFVYAMRMTSCADISDDITQETFIRVHTHLRKGNVLVDPIPFCLMIARQRVMNVVRNSKQTTSIEEDSLVVDPHEALHAEDLRSHIALALHRLPDPAREAFVLRYYDGLSYDEIASVTNETAGTVRMRVFRAKTLLKVLLRVVVGEVRS